MIYLRIDGQQVDIDQKINPAIKMEIADIEEPENSSEGYSKTVEVPFTPRNMRIFGFTNELYSKEQFNNALHTAEYSVDDTVILSGVAQMEKFTYVTGANGQISGKFHVTVVGAAYEWITAARKPINELESDQTVVYDMQPVYENSICEQPSLIKFFPVDRGAFWEKGFDDKLVQRQKLSLYDYHPFLNVWLVLELIFKGYSIRTSLRGLFERLYTSGRIPEVEDVSFVQEENDFYIGAKSLVKRSVGAFDAPCLIDLYNSWEGDDYHNKQHVIQIADIGPTTTSALQPTEDVLVGLETCLECSSQIQNGYAGTGRKPGIGTDNDYLDVVTTPGECFYVDTFQQTLGANTETIRLTLDKCEEAKTRISLYDTEPYTPESDSSEHTFVVCMDSKLDAQYWVLGPLAGMDRLGKIKKGRNWFVTTSWMTILNKTWFRLSADGSKIDYDFRADDQLKECLSDFYCFEISDRTVTFKLENATLNSYSLKKEVLYPIYGVFFCSQQLFGSPLINRIEPVSLSVGLGNSIKPAFSAALGLKDPIGIRTVGGTDAQLDYLAALRQMFNLMFYTNPLSREVFIEPRTMFYNLNRNKMVDWRAKIDHSKGIIVEQLGADVGNALKLSYAEGGDPIQYANWKKRVEVGACTVPLLNKVADEIKQISNPIFAPFLLRNVEAMGDMQLVQNKRETTQDTIEDVEMDVTPVVGYFSGTSARSNKGSGSDAGEYDRYPRLVFQDYNEGINLGFDDIESLPTVYGLNHYYRDNISLYNNGRRITLYLHLDPQDIEALQMPNDQMRDMRAVFLLHYDGEDIPCMLQSISDYNPEGGASTKCQFIFDPNIPLTGNDLVVISYDDKVISYDNTVMGYEKEE